MLCMTINARRINKKIEWVINDETIFVTGNICEWNNVFLMRWTLEIITPEQPLIISENRNQAAIPEVSQTTKGTLFKGWTLNPTLKTTQKTKTITIGFINVHINPKTDPVYCLATSLFAMANIVFFCRNISLIK